MPNLLDVPRHTLGHQNRWNVRPVCWFRCTHGRSADRSGLGGRRAAHEAGGGGKYTGADLPVERAYYEILPSRHEAMSRERQIKGLRREEKLALISEKEKQNHETN